MTIIDFLVEMLGPIPAEELTNGAILYYIFGFVLIIYCLKVLLKLFRSIFNI